MQIKVLTITESKICADSLLYIDLRVDIVIIVRPRGKKNRDYWCRTLPGEQGH